MRKCWWEGLGTWPFMVKGHQHQIFLANSALSSKGFQYSSSFGWRLGWHFGSQCIWRQKFFPLYMLWLQDLWSWSAGPEWHLSTSSNRTGLFWAGSAVTHGPALTKEQVSIGGKGLFLRAPVEDILNSSHIVASVLNTATQIFYIQIFISKHLIPR